jgi:tripartite-type tricarboxylate transporter receptor subunit TctC
MIEAGVPNYTATTWNGILAPAGTPKAVIDRLNDVFVRAVQSPEVKAEFAKIGQDTLTSTPEEFSKLLRDETAKWTKVIETAHIQAP